MKKFIRSSLLHFPLMISCQELDEFISDYIEGKLPATINLKFRLHLIACRDCKSYISAYKRSIEMSKALCERLDSEIPDDVPEALISFVLENFKKKDHKED